MKITINDCFEEFKGRSDIRRNHWFKFEADFFLQPEVFCLTREQQCVLIYLFCLRCSQESTHNEVVFNIPFAQTALKFECETKLTETLKDLEQQGYIAIEDNYKPTLVAKKASFEPVNQVSIDSLVELWNSKSQGMAKCKTLTKKRKETIKVRLQEKPNMEYWEAVIDKMNKSDFCIGKSTPFKATFDWFIKDETHIKVMEGCYDTTAGARRDKTNEPTLTDEEFEKYEDEVFTA